MGFRLGFFLGLWIAASLPVSAAEEPTCIYSPNKAFVVAWFDRDTGEPVGETRSVILLQLPHGDKPFSLVTFPRHTLAAWSPDSKHCVIIDAPDNGNTDVWLFTASNAATQSPAIPISPLKPLYEAFHANWDGHHLWRPGISKAVWKDNETLELEASDNNGAYKITISMNTPDKPAIVKVP
jgi:hypothetical protein